MQEQDRSMTVRLPARLLKSFKIKCIDLEVEQSSVVRDLLSEWVDGSIPLPTQAKTQSKVTREKKVKRA